MLLLPALAALLAAGVAHARGPAKPTVAGDPAISPTASSLPDSVRRVERQTGGEVLQAEPMQQDGHEIYRLKVLTRDGRVHVLQDNPASPANAPSPTRKPKANDGEAGVGGG